MTIEPINMTTETTAQQVFDYVAKFLLAQGKAAIVGTKSVCRYRTDDGLKCAVGCLIPDEDYDTSWEGPALNMLLRETDEEQRCEDGPDRKPMRKELHDALFAHRDLLQDLQMAHDEDLLGKFISREEGFSSDVPEWRRAMREVAVTHGLSAAVLD